MKRVALSTLAALTLATAASAQSYLISRIKPGVNPKEIATTYGLILVDYISGGPFAYFKAATLTRVILRRTR